MYLYESMNQRNTRKYLSYTLTAVHRRGIIETFSHKRTCFDVDRVSLLMDIDQRHTVDFRILSGSVAMLGKRPKHVPNNIS